jgi:hypothetical protein
MDHKDKKECRICKRLHFNEEILIEGMGHCSVSSDISENGLYVCTMQPLEKDSIIQIAIPFRGQKINVKTRVQYAHPGIGMGLIFIDLNEGQKAMIIELMETIKE